MEIGGRRYVLIDTAGIRRRSKVYVPMEKIAVAMAEKAVGRCDVCVLADICPSARLPTAPVPPTRKPRNGPGGGLRPRSGG